MEVATRRFVRPEFLNHHKTMYAGYVSEWLTEAAMIGATGVFGSGDNIVLGTLKEIRLASPVTAGVIVELRYQVGHIGTTSLEILVEGRDFLSGKLYFSGGAVFVSVDDEGRKAPHGLAGGKNKLFL